MKDVRRKRVVLCTVVMLGICGSSIYAGGKKEEPSQEPATRTVTDGTGREVRIPESVTRIAASGALNQMVFMVGGADTLVATAEGVQTGLFAKVFPGIKDIPAAYQGGGRGTLNMETLLAASPQVVFGTFDENDAAVLSGAGIAMVGVVLLTPDDIMQTLQIVGKIVGPEAEKKAIAFSEYYTGNIETAKSLTAPAETVRVFVAGSDGSKGPVTTIAGNDINSSYIAAAGGINIAARQFPTASAGGSATVNFEFLLAEQPDVILTSSRTVFDYITDASNNSEWQSLDAVIFGRVYLNPKGVYLWSVRSAEGALQPLWIAKVLHPDITESIDLEQTVRAFYKEYYYYELSDDELADILFPPK